MKVRCPALVDPQLAESDGALDPSAEVVNAVISISANERSAATSRINAVDDLHEGVRPA